MDVSDHMTPEPMLLLLERAQAPYPLNPNALTVSQSSKSKLKKDYVGEHLLDQNGSLFVIKDIVVLGVYGDSLGRKVLSALTGARSIKTELEKVSSLSLDEVKSMIVRFVRFDAETNDPIFANKQMLDAVLQRINLSTTIGGVFTALEMPKLEDCLDVL